MSITVNAVNDAPVCQDLSLATAKNVAVGGTVTCTDVENDPLVLRVSTPPGQRHGVPVRHVDRRLHLHAGPWT